MPEPMVEVLADKSLTLVGPALLTSLVLMPALMLVLLALRATRLAPLAAALALAAGVFVGNETRLRDPIRVHLDTEPTPEGKLQDRPLTVDDLATVLGWSLEAKPPPKVGDPEASDSPEPEYELPLPPPGYWLPWLGGLALLVELLARLPRVPASLGWTARTLVAVLAGRLLTAGLSTSFEAPPLRVEMPWVPWCLSAALLAEWALLTHLARRWRDGTVPAALALCCAAAGLVAACAPAPRLSELAPLVGAVLAGPAIVAWLVRGDTGPALAPVAVLLPGAMTVCQWNPIRNEPPVPWEGFLLMGLAPLALAPLVLPGLARLRGWKRWLPALVLPLIPATVAVILAAQDERLPF